MAKEGYVLEGYQFKNQQEYDRAKKEKETIAYLMANTDSSDMKALLKIYNRSVDKQSFQTIIGQQFLCDLRKRLIGSQLVSEDTLAPIRVSSASGNEKNAGEKLNEKKVEKYKEAYENAVAGQKIKNLIIAGLIVVILGMVAITASTRYSVFTYFTNYEENIREEVIDEMQKWEKELEEREKALEQKESALQ